MKLAAANGDISTIISLLSMSSALTPADYIKKTVGSVLFLYYTYEDKFRCRPLDLDDLIDGLLYQDAKNYVIQQNMNMSERKK